jgi:AraC-like DNA-binding protein
MGEPGSSDHPGTATDPRNSRRLIEIGLEVGYTSPSYFARVFRRVVGVTPAVYGLNGHRSNYIISLFKVTYKSTVQISRNFTALFTKTLENSDI